MTAASPPTQTKNLLHGSLENLFFWRFRNQSNISERTSPFPGSSTDTRSSKFNSRSSRLPSRAQRQQTHTYLISCPQICELVLSFGVVRVSVGMQLKSQFPVGLLDVPDRRALAHPQNLIEVSPTREGGRVGEDGRDGIGVSVPTGLPWARHAELQHHPVGQRQTPERKPVRRASC